MSDTMMFLDHGPDSFLSEVIRIVRLTNLLIDIKDNQSTRSKSILWPIDTKVKVTVTAIDPNNRERPNIHIVKFGRSYGEALRKVREEIRERTGK